MSLQLHPPQCRNANSELKAPRYLKKNACVDSGTIRHLGLVMFL